MKFDKLYYDPKGPAGYAGEQALYKLARKSSKTFKLKDVKNWLKKQQTYTLHKEADLADMSKLSNSNDKFKFLLCIVDVFSNDAWVVPIKDKTGKTLVNAFKSVLKSGRSPKSLQTDKGTELKNKHFQTFLKSKKIHFFTTENPETKASIVERFQRTLKSGMWKYFTHHYTLRYVDILSKLVEGYNHAYHQSIKRAPISVTPKNEHQVSEILFGKSNCQNNNQNSKWVIM